MTATFIVSANAGRARIFLQSDPSGRLEEINDMVSAQPNGYEPHQTPSQHEAELFARDVAKFLLEAHNEGRFGKLCLVAAPEFLGVLRREVEPKLKSMLSLAIDKDYTRDTPTVLLDRLKRAGLRPQ